MKARTELGDIFRQYGDRFRHSHPLSMACHKAMNAIEACRTAQLGGHVDQCDDCGHVRISYNSCRNRHCPKCQALATARWLEARKAELLSVKHFHLVFTLPHELHGLMRANERLSYTLLFRAAAETIVQLARQKKHLHAQTGLMAVLHTWGQTLMYHPHLHCLVPAGGLSLDGKKWIASRRRFFLPVKVMSRLFRGKFLAGIKAAYLKGELNCPDLPGNSGELKAMNDFLRPLYHKEWVVYAKPPFGGAEQVIAYLGRYTHRVALSNHRILESQDDQVSFSYRDYADRDRAKTMTLSAEEFIRRFLLHILPRGFHKIRYYGLLATRHRKTLHATARRLLGQGPVEKPAKLPWYEQLEKLTGKDPRNCPRCKAGRMQTMQQLEPAGRSPPAYQALDPLVLSNP